MLNKGLITEEDVILRRNAEDIIAGLPENLDGLSSLKLSEMLHELRVHQIELSMQNEALRQAQAKTATLLARYLGFYDQAPVGYCTISEKGIILEANLTVATILGIPKNAMIQQPLSKFIFNEDHEFYYSHKIRLFKTDEPQKCDLRMVKQDGTIFWVHIEAVEVQDEEGLSVCRLVINDITERKQTEDKLRESEEQFRTMFEDHNAIMFLVDPETGRIIKANQSAEKYYGYTVKELETLTVLQINKAPGEKIIASMTNAHAMRRNYFNFSHRLANGAIRDVEVHSSPIKFNGKNILFSIVHDITDRKQAEAALFESEEKYRVIFNNEIYAICIFDIETLRFIDVNDAYTKVYGYSREELVSSMTIHDITVEHEESESATKQSVNDGQTILIPMRYHRKKDGTVFPVEIVGGPYTWKGRKVMFGLAHNITNRIQAEEKLRLFKTIIESSHEAIVISGKNGQLVYINPAHEKLFGRSYDEAIKMNYRDYYYPSESFELLKQEVVPAMMRGESWKGELDAFDADGRRFQLWARMGSIVDKEGNLLFSFGFMHDISDRKLAEKELQETNIALAAAIERANEMAKKAQMADIAKSEFLANMSHEIRTPMNGVIGMTNLLLDTELDDEQQHFAATVQSSAESLLCLINDILDFSKIEAKKLDLEIIDFDLANLLDDFASTMAIKSYEKGLELICSAEPDVPVLLKGDPGRLRQILTNLAGNAIKFTAQGEVVVRVAKIQEGDNDVLLRFSVFDTGIGIPEDKIGILFEKFSQADASTTRQYGGTGLGLSISKQLAELMGGEIGVISEEGKGSEFWFTACFVKQPEAAQCGERELADLDNVRALIVDDNATNREILVKRMTSWGMRPFEAADSPTALHSFYKALNENDPFKIAVIDMNMPFMDGETLGLVLKSDPRIADTKLVLLTSFEQRGDAKHFTEIGFDGYLTKPVRHGELMVVMAMALTEPEERRNENRDNQESKSTQPTPRFIATRHTATATLNMFADCNARILLVEDNITNQQVALGILKKLGLKANAVANGEEAIRAVETIPYDLILMDVQMPVMDGLEATRRIRNPDFIGVNRNISIIAMTANAMQGDRERCIEAGIMDPII